MSKYEFGFDKSNDKDYNCVTVLDTETNELEAYYRYQDIARDKDHRIAELEQKLENAIVLPVKLKTEGYHIRYIPKLNGDIRMEVEKVYLDRIEYFDNHYKTYKINDIFATEQEARKELEELNNGKA